MKEIPSQKRWRLANAEKIRTREASPAYAARRRAWKKANLVKMRAYRLAYAQNHPEEVRAQAARSYQKHREERRIKGKLYSATHREAIHARCRRWVEAHRERARELDSLGQERRRARLAGLPATLTAAEWSEIVEEFGRRCAYCGAELAKLIKEHIVPVSRGGGTTRQNIVPSCTSCNSSKGTKLVSEWNALKVKIAQVQGGR